MAFNPVPENLIEHGKRAMARQSLLAPYGVALGLPLSLLFGIAGAMSGDLSRTAICAAVSLLTIRCGYLVITRRNRR